MRNQHCGASLALMARRSPPTTKRQRSPKTRLTVALIDSISRAVAAGAPVATASRYVGIDQSTLYRWLRDGDTKGKRYELHRKLKRSLMEAREKAQMSLIADVRSSARDVRDSDGNFVRRGDWRAAAWLLSRRWPDQWADPSRRAAARVLDAQADMLDASGVRPIDVDSDPAKALGLTDEAELAELGKALAIHMSSHTDEQ